MKISDPALLEAIFAIKGNFAEGVSPRRISFSGVEIAPFKGNAGAAACISADFEMGWGWRSRGQQGAQLMGEAERRHVPLILRLLEDYDVPITWATIGHLFLESCQRSATGLAHPTMARPVSDGTWSGDWYSPDPCSNVRETPAWYAPDLIEDILASPVGHEVGTHSFSHINFQSAYSSADVVSGELQTCVDLMRPFGLTPRTLVFPRNQSDYSHLPLLARAGVTVVRHRDPHIRLSYPARMESGVYRIVESMNLRIASHYDYLDKVKIFIGRAVERHAAYALWFHPSDPIEWFDPQLRAILKYLAAERNRGRLWIATMEEIAAYCEAREQLRLRVERTQSSVTIAIEGSFDSSRYGIPDVTLIVPVPAKPHAAWIAAAGGDQTPVEPHAMSDDSRRATFNVPAIAKVLHLEF